MTCFGRRHPILVVLELYQKQVAHFGHSVRTDQTRPESKFHVRLNCGRSNPPSTYFGILHKYWHINDIRLLNLRKKDWWKRIPSIVRLYRWDCGLNMEKSHDGGSGIHGSDVIVLL